MRRKGLAPFKRAAVGGWDIRPTPIGQALREARILDYDLVRQLEGTLDGVEVLPGVYDPRYVGESQRATATHIKNLPDARSKVDALREDLRAFKASQDRWPLYSNLFWKRGGAILATFLRDLRRAPGSLGE